MAIEIDPEYYSSTLTEEELEFFLKEHPKTVVRFTATWCKPCRDIEEHYKKIAIERMEELGFLKIDIDSNRDLSIRSSIKTIPRIEFYYNGIQQSKFSVGGGWIEKIEENMDEFIDFTPTSITK